MILFSAQIKCVNQVISYSNPLKNTLNIFNQSLRHNQEADSAPNHVIETTMVV